MELTCSRSEDGPAFSAIDVTTITAFAGLSHRLDSKPEPSALRKSKPESTPMPFRLLPAGLEEAQFKRIPEGWLFTTVNPWLFAPRRTYVVSDAQKPAIAARIRHARYLRVPVMFAMMALMVAAIVMNPALL